MSINIERLQQRLLRAVEEQVKDEIEDIDDKYIKIAKEIKVYKNNDIKINFKNESITIDKIDKFEY